MSTQRVKYLIMSGLLDNPAFLQQNFDSLVAFCGLNSRQQDFKSSQLIWRNICFDGLNPQGHNHIPNLRENALLFTWKDFSLFFFRLVEIPLPIASVLIEKGDFVKIFILLHHSLKRGQQYPSLYPTWNAL